MEPGCLDDDVISRLADGDLAPDELDSVESHIDRCSDCRQVVVALGTVDPSARGDLPWLREGDSVDRYEIRGWLGAGGMGQVYRAHDPQLGRDVALKLVRAGLDPAANERLAREARAMAQLVHPNVVSVHDAGESDGRTFIAMELIEGSTLRESVRSETRERGLFVRTFIQAGRGLAAAHRKKILHRDFKPANVLVDATDWARVGDFGLASLGPAGAAADDAAGTKARGTPAYMAPEYAAGTPASEATDVYSFATSLRECLELAGIDDARLAAIAERGSAAEPGARQSSMVAVIADLEAAMRRRRFRAPVVVALTGVVAAAVAGGLYWRSASGPTPCSDLLEQRDSVRQRASSLDGELGLRVNAAVTDYLGRHHTQIIRTCAAPPSELRTAQLDCLEVRLSEVGFELERVLKSTNLSIPNVVGALYALPTPAECAPAQVAALEAARRASSLPPALTEKLERKLATAIDSRREGDLEESLELLEQLTSEVAGIDYSAFEARAYFELAEVREFVAKPPQVRDAAQKALKAAQTAGDGPLMVESALLLAQLDIEHDHEAPSIDAWLDLARANFDRIGRPAALESSVLQTTGYVAMLRGDYDIAVADFARAIEVNRVVQGPRSPQLAADFYNYASALQLRGDYDDALVQLAAAKEIFDDTFGPIHEGTPAVLTQMARIESQRGDHAAAERGLREALERAIAIHGAESHAVATAHHSLGVVLSRLERFAEAERELERGIELLIAHSGEDSDQVGHARVALAENQYFNRRFAEALVTVDLALKALDGDDPYAALPTALRRRGMILCELGRCREGLKPMRRALEMKAAQVADHSSLAHFEYDLGTALFLVGDKRAALEHLRRAIERSLGLPNPLIEANMIIDFVELTSPGNKQRTELLDRASQRLSPDRAEHRDPLDTIKALRR